jgi:hypothetical protein
MNVFGQTVYDYKNYGIAHTISKSKMISRRQGGGAGGVYENTLRTPTTKPTKIAL